MLPMQRAQVRSLVGELRSHMLQLSTNGLTTEPTHYKAHTPQLDKPMCCNEDPEPPKQIFFFFKSLISKIGAVPGTIQMRTIAHVGVRDQVSGLVISAFILTVWDGMEWSGVE